jgi:hypothetical protein
VPFFLQDHQRNIRFAKNFDIDSSDSDEYQSVDNSTSQELMVSHHFLCVN